MRSPSRSLFLLAVLALVCVPATASASAAKLPKLPTLRLSPMTGFFQPVDVAAPRADRHRIFVVQKAGGIRVVLDGKRLAKPFLDVRPSVDSLGEERGLLSMAFAPDYATSGLFYISYTAKDGAVTLEEYKRSQDNPNRADPSSRRTVLVQRHPNHNHNSGELQFGPDGLLYMGLGDGGGSGDRPGNAQNLGVRLGKILRIDPRNHQQLAPPNNPFFSRGGASPEIYAYGFRNPWRFSFDRGTGDMTIADVGQDEVEEVNYLRKGKAEGRNFGWNRCEGTQAFPATTPAGGRCTLKGTVRPEIELRHSAGYCAVIGGFVVRDRSLGALVGRYLYSDWCKGELLTARLGGSASRRDNRSTGTAFAAPTAFGEDAGGCLYVTSISGTVARIRAVQPDDKPATPGTADGPGCMPLQKRASADERLH